MRDCEEVEMRELLPGYLLGRLTPADRTGVDAHLRECEACRAELEVLALARDVMDHVPLPALDPEAITRALPKPARVRSRRLRVFGAPAWRIAAGLTLVTLGGVSVRGARRSLDPVPAIDSGAAVGAVLATVPESLPAADPPGVPDPRGGTGSMAMTAGADVSSLADEDLEALIGALDRIEATPHAEPEANPASRMVRIGTGDN